MAYVAEIRESLINILRGGGRFSTYAGINKPGGDACPPLRVRLCCGIMWVESHGSPASHRMRPESCPRRIHFLRENHKVRK